MIQKLRIGNYFLHNDHLVQIASIDITEKNHKVKIQFPFKKTDSFLCVHPEELKPITLDSDILSFFSIQESNDLEVLGLNLYEKGVFLFAELPGDCLFVFLKGTNPSNSVITTIRYLHSLQNFWITVAGFELEPSKMFFDLYS